MKTTKLYPKPKITNAPPNTFAMKWASRSVSFHFALDFSGRGVELEGLKSRGGGEAEATNAQEEEDEEDKSAAFVKFGLQEEEEEVAMRDGNAPTFRRSRSADVREDGRGICWFLV